MNPYEVDNEFSRRVSLARASKGITQTELSTMVGISQRQVAAYESGESKPRKGTLLKLAKALNVLPEWLSQGYRELQKFEGALGIEDEMVISQMNTVPLITLGMVADWLSTQDDYTDALRHQLMSSSLTSKAFAIELADEAMASSDVDGYGFPLGSVVTFEPGIIAEDKDFVIAIFPNGKALFRQYFSGMIESVLAPLDARFPQERIDNEYVENGEITLIVAIEIRVALPAMSRLEVMGNH